MPPVPRHRSMSKPGTPLTYRNVNVYRVGRDSYEVFVNVGTAALKH